MTHHTIETSAVILIGLGFVLSPYLLLGAAVFLLLFGVPNIPVFMRPLVPAPLLEARPLSVTIPLLSEFCSISSRAASTCCSWCPIMLLRTVFTWKPVQQDAALQDLKEVL